MNKLNASQIRKSHTNLAKIKQQKLQRNPIVLVLDNVYDTYNIGSFFRLADALSAQKIFICGSVVTPPNTKIHRASIGTWKWIPWQHFDDSLTCIKLLKKQGYQIISCELGKKSIPYNLANYKSPVAIVAGNETSGVSKQVLDISDLVVEVPMYGINKSLNTLIATSIISYQAISQQKTPRNRLHSNR